MKDLPEIKNIRVEINTIENNIVLNKKVSLSILRLDAIHPEVSGNKFFKLYYFIQQAITEQKNIITLGGAYSNHLYATALACNQYGIGCTGIVRGEEPAHLSSTLLFCQEMGMRLQFISREKYRAKDDKDFKMQLVKDFGENILIPEGGFCPEGIKGASLIPELYHKEKFTHICCAVGSAATLAGLIRSSLTAQQIRGFSAVKDNKDLEERLHNIYSTRSNNNYSIINDYNFGGFAKKTDELILFMNNFYDEFKIPTDFVYTAKMMFGIFDLIAKNYFTPGSKILCIHTGGLQGNLSLKEGTLNF